MSAAAPPPWLARPPGGELLPLAIAAVVATYGVGAIMNIRDDEAKGYAVIVTGLTVGLVSYGLKQACGSTKTGFCLLGSG